MRNFLRLFVVFVGVLCIATTASLAAPPPTEVEKRKNEASIHVIGTVSADELFKDTTEDKHYPQQVRKMNLKVDRLIKVPDTEKGKTSFEVFYWYIPSWQEKEYTGGERMDIAVEDVVEIWLVEGEYGWEPVLGGNTVKHIKYADEDSRTEPIPEPFLHFIERKAILLTTEKLEMFVLFVLSLILILIIIKASNTKKAG